MNIRIEPVALLVAMAVLAAGCVSSTGTRPAWAHEVVWLGDKPDGRADIETGLWTQIAPYNTDYDRINITAKRESSGVRLRVAGISNSIEYPDIYDFTYSEGKLTRTGYLLEAIPPQDRDRAIGAAMQSRDIRNSMATGAPTVRRILPDTSKKYYASKTLLSVTWTGTSVLVDPDEWKAVQVWNSGVNP